MTSETDHTDTIGEGRVALVTGGSRGIGRACVEGLLEEGYRVYFCSKNPSSVEEAQSDLRDEYDDRVTGRAVDARDQGEVEAYVAEVLEEAGRLDVLVNNAGLGHFGKVDELTGDQWREVIDTNLTGAFYFLRAVAPAMREQRSGFVFNIASLAGKNPFSGGAAYNASKFGMIGLSDAAMLDLRQDGVRVTVILPGSVDTDFHAKDDTGWMMRPEDIAQAVTDLLHFPPRTLPSRVELRPTKPAG
jgi:3-oxoacyl-[acyl-carrier protein] reductase